MSLNNVKKILLLTPLFFGCIYLYWQSNHNTSTTLAEQTIELLAIKGVLNETDLTQLEIDTNSKANLTEVPFFQLIETLRAKPKSYDLVLAKSSQLRQAIEEGLLKEKSYDDKRPLHEFIEKDFLYTSIDPKSNYLLPFLWALNKTYINNNSISKPIASIIKKGSLLFPQDLSLFLLFLVDNKLISTKGEDGKLISELLDKTTAIFEKTIFFKLGEKLKLNTEHLKSSIINVNHTSLDIESLKDLTESYSQTSVGSLVSLSFAYTLKTKSDKLRNKWLKDFLSHDIANKIAKRLNLASCLKVAENTDTLAETQKPKFLRNLSLRKIKIASGINIQSNLKIRLLSHLRQLMLNKNNGNKIK